MPAPTDGKLRGLIAATYTPFSPNGDLNCRAVPALVDHLLRQGVTGLYVCGSTGEGMSMTTDERRQTARAFVEAAQGRVPVVVQVGHNSLWEAAALARHAQEIGATAVSATCPSYFPIDSVENLVESMTIVAAGAPQLPFYYYHIPRFTGAGLDMTHFLRLAASRIPNLAGLKYSDPTAHGYQACVEFDASRFDILWGVDEMLLSALVVGCQGAVGSTYNVMAPVYRELIDAFTHGDIAHCRDLQAKSAQFVRTVSAYPFHPGMKEILRWQGVDCGVCRLPIHPITHEQAAALRKDLEQIEFF